MNEPLCRALIEARLTEEDVAARLQVDPKTVRRWLEGRVPYLRHRWAIAALLGVGETDLWPQLRTTRTRPDEVIAIYPRRDAVPREVWLRLFGSAQHEIGILEETNAPIGGDQAIADVLAERARSGVRLRICLRTAGETLAGQGGQAQGNRDAAASAGAAVAIYAPLPEKGGAEIRIYKGVVYNSIYYADGQMLVSQHVYGLPATSAPTLHLERPQGSDMTAAYLDAFEISWATAAAE